MLFHKCAFLSRALRIFQLSIVKMIRARGSMTLLHYAESVADVPNKRVIRYQIPVVRKGKREWVEIEEFDTCGNILPHAEQYFDAITRAYLASGKGIKGKVGTADSYLFDAADLVKFAVQ